MSVRNVGLSGLLLGAAAAGVIYRSARTVAKARTVVPLRHAAAKAMMPPTVTAVVPARNEDVVIDDCVRGLRTQTHGGHDESSLRMVFVDDGSTDRTGEIVREHAERDERVKTVRVDEPPPGWSGKVHAMHVGVEAAGEPEPGEWLLFVDADTVLAPDLVERLIATAESVDADLVSTPGGPPAEHSVAWPLLMPPGLQMISENASPDGRGRKAFAIGHCIMVRRSHYEKVGGWAALASLRNEDIALATTVRDHGGSIRIVDGLDHATTSGMDPFSQGWSSFRKSFVAGTKGSLPVLVGGGLGQVVLSLVSPAAAFAGLRRREPALAAVGMAGWVAQSTAHVYTARFMRAKPALAPFAPVTGALFGGVLLDGALRVLRGRTSWKGRRTPF